MFTKYRQSIESRLFSLVKKDLTSITYSTSEINSVCHLITNPELLNHLLFSCYDRMVTYSAVRNEVTLRRLEETRTDKHLTLTIESVVVNPKKREEVQVMLQGLQGNRRVVD